MHPLPLLSAPQAICVAHESLDGLAADRSEDAPPSPNGFELVPAWQARPPRRLRRLPAGVVPGMAVSVLVALSADHGDAPRALREPAAAQRSTRAPASALVVRATNPGRGGG